MTEATQAVLWGLGILWGCGSVASLVVAAGIGGNTPADHRTAMALIVAWPLVLVALAARALWSYACWLVSDLRPAPRPNVRAGYRDAAEREEGR